MYRPKYICDCPFYENEYRRSICCSGVESAEQTRLAFSTEEEKWEYIKIHCIHKRPENCPIFQKLKEKYKLD